MEFNFYLSEEIGRLKDLVANAQTLKESENDQAIKENLFKVHQILSEISKEPINNNTLYKVLQIQQLEKEIVS